MTAAIGVSITCAVLHIYDQLSQSNTTTYHFTREHAKLQVVQQQLHSQHPCSIEHVAPVPLLAGTYDAPLAKGTRQQRTRQRHRPLLAAPRARRSEHQAPSKGLHQSL